MEIDAISWCSALSVGGAEGAQGLVLRGGREVFLDGQL